MWFVGVVRVPSMHPHALGSLTRIHIAVAHEFDVGSQPEFGCPGTAAGLGDACFSL